MGYSNGMSKSFLTYVVCGCREIWLRVQFKVIQRAQLPLRLRIILWIPPPDPEKEETDIKILTKQTKTCGSRIGVLWLQPRASQVLKTICSKLLMTSHSRNWKFQKGVSSSDLTH